MAVGHLDARELPGRGVSEVRGVLRARGTARGTGRGHRRRQPLPADGGPRTEGGGVRRPAARRGCDRHRRGAPVARRGRAVPRLQRQHAATCEPVEGRGGRTAAGPADGGQGRRRAGRPRCADRRSDRGNGGPGGAARARAVAGAPARGFQWTGRPCTRTRRGDRAARRPRRAGGIRAAAGAARGKRRAIARADGQRKPRAACAGRK